MADFIISVSLEMKIVLTININNTTIIQSSNQMINIEMQYKIYENLYLMYSI